MTITVLAAIDLEDADSAAHVAAAATRYASAEGATLHALNVIPDSGMSLVGSYLSKEHFSEMMGNVRSAFASWAGDYMPEVSSDHLHVVQGSIYDKIISTARTIEADTIVIGAHRPEFRDYLVGPNAARVVRHAPQSVLVVR